MGIAGAVLIRRFLIHKSLGIANTTARSILSIPKPPILAT
jgi:hypothetical protein